MIFQESETIELKEIIIPDMLKILNADGIDTNLGLLSQCRKGRNTRYMIPD